MTDSRAGTILLVEDDVDVREALTEILEDAGYGVSVATNGEDALQLADACESPPRLILLDLMMPRMDGWQFLEETRLRASLAGVPIVVLSARNESNSGGVTAYLRKPFEAEALLHLVQDLCGPPNKRNGSDHFPNTTLNAGKPPTG